MGDIRTKADSVYRDHNLAGVASSGRHEPPKAKIRELFATLDIAVYAAQSGMATVANVAARDAFYADEANQAKLVYVNNNNGAADDPANGVYEYVGGARLATGFYQGVAGAVQPLVDQIEATADSLSDALNGLAETDTIGRPVEPVDGSAGSANTRIFDQPVLRSGRIKKIWLYSSLTGSNTATLKIKVFNRDAGAGDLTTGDGVTGTNAATLTITGGGLKVFSVDIPVDGGQFIGWYHSVNGAVDFLTATTSDSGGFWSDAGAVGDNLEMTATSYTIGAQWQIGFDIIVSDAAKARLAAVEQTLDGLSETDMIGRVGTPVTGSASTANTRIFNNPVARTGMITKVRLFSLLTGSNTATLKVKVATRDAGPGQLVSGDAITLVDAAVLTITGGGLKEFDVAIPVEAGQFVGWYHSATAGVSFLASTLSDSGGFWSDTGAVGDNAAMTVNSKTTSAQWQIGFDVRVPIDAEYIGGVKDRADYAYEAVLSGAIGTGGRKQRPIPGIAADIDWAMCVSADFITPGREVGTGNQLFDWLDRSGNGNSLASTTSPRPVYDPDAFGADIPGLQFIGGDDGASGDLRVMYLQRSMRLTQPFTVVAIVQIPSVNSAELRLVEGYSDVDATDRCALGLSAGAKPYIAVAPAQTIVSPSAISADAPHLLIGTYNKGESSIMVDGEIKAVGTISGNLHGLMLGAGRSSVALWNGAVGMLGYANGILSEPQIAAIEEFAASRYGVIIS